MKPVRIDVLYLGVSEMRGEVRDALLKKSEAYKGFRLKEMAGNFIGKPPGFTYDVLDEMVRLKII